VCRFVQNGIGGRYALEPQDFGEFAKPCPCRRRYAFGSALHDQEYLLERIQLHDVAHEPQSWMAAS
jgi:hypothetical protein